ncbi:zinc ABC transporter ATP-binding protein ZnuC [Mergibacter septicus]|uniref:zinc ABC transporter ATP-binding protein ZnuC n=1 Tax=Mergibacter septicus TaxID=221402 RepID=UPI001179487D|nr:zinc ABC transporter ATP-binding protein ZnuC [Mergibacter septicus]AWX13197.1 zinc ABC transporter ATP-binding protein ZnuC [Mergibacter septicus]
MTEQPKTLIELRDVSVTIGEKNILENINLRVDARSITTIVGPNGGGKSTLLKVILKLIKPQAGEVIYHAGLKIGYVPQKIHLDHTFPINVDKFLSLKAGITPAEIDHTLNLLSIAHLRKSSIHKLSGGEMQRVLLARAILSRPNLLLLDEPTQGVDISGQVELYQLINQTRDLLHCAVVMVSHDLHLVMANTDHVLCINRHLCCSGTPETVVVHPKFIGFFGEQIGKETGLALYTHRHNHKHNLHGDVCCSGQHHRSDCQHQFNKD